MSQRVFDALDAHTWRLVHKWTSRHPTKPARWIRARYFGKFHPSRQDTWVFGSRDSGYYLRKFAWPPIVRHRMVDGGSSPDDPSLATYWAQRRRRAGPPVGSTLLTLLREQDGRCPLCHSLLLHADRQPQSPTEWEQWLTGIRKATRRAAVI